MAEHAQEIVPLLLWMVVVVGAALLALVLWVGKRMQTAVDKMPELVTKKVQTLHDEILRKMDEMNKTHKELERDIRSAMTELDRRVVALEVRCDLNHRSGG